MKSRVRLVDIANELGVSVNTVSLALSGSTRISSKTRLLIEQTAKERGYVPNGFARSLVKQESNYIGVILRSLKNPVLINIAREIEHTLKERGFFMILMSAKGNAIQEINALRIQQVSGILIYPDFSEINLKKLEQLRNDGFPLVLMSSDGKVQNIDTVFMDRTVGAYRATAYLAHMGHRHIGYIVGDACKTEGYRSALKKYDIPYNEDYVAHPEGISYQAGYTAAETLLAKSGDITALFASTDTYAIGAMRYCLDHGVSVPSDVSIVGYDNIDEAEFAPIRLTTIAYDIKKEVELAIDLLQRRISRDENSPAPEIIRLEPELIIRDSCGAINTSKDRQEGSV